LTGIVWLLVGAGVGFFYGLCLWGSLAALQPAQQERSLLLVLGSGLLRCLTVAAVLALAARGGWRSCLLALGGFLVTRLVLMGMMGMRLRQE